MSTNEAANLVKLPKLLGKAPGMADAVVGYDYSGRITLTIRGMFRKDPKVAVNEYLASIDQPEIKFGGMGEGTMSRMVDGPISVDMEYEIQPWSPRRPKRKSVRRRIAVRK